MSGVWSLLVTDPDSNYPSCLLKSLSGSTSLLGGPRLEAQDIEKDKETQPCPKPKFPDLFPMW